MASHLNLIHKIFPKEMAKARSFRMCCLTTILILCQDETCTVKRCILEIISLALLRYVVIQRRSCKEKRGKWICVPEISHSYASFYLWWTRWQYCSVVLDWETICLQDQTWEYIPDISDFIQFKVYPQLTSCSDDCLEHPTLICSSFSEFWVQKNLQLSSYTCCPKMLQNQCWIHLIKSDGGEEPRRCLWRGSTVLDQETSSTLVSAFFNMGQYEIIFSYPFLLCKSN